MNTEPLDKASAKATSPDPRSPAGESDFGSAYERRLAEIHAVPEESMAPVNLDLRAAVAMVLGVLPEIRALRSEMETVPNLDLALIDGLEEYAQAAGEAHSRYVTTKSPKDDIVPLNEAALKARQAIRSDAHALAARGLIDPNRLSPFTGRTGYRNVAFELIDWAILMRECWPAIRGKTALSADEIQKAKLLGELLVRMAGHREQAPVLQAEAARIRQQAFTVLLASYDEVRRAVHYLRWRQKDADSIAPSLYTKRKRKASRNADAATADEILSTAAGAATKAAWVEAPFAT